MENIDNERGYWRYILFDGVAKHTCMICTDLDHLVKKTEAYFQKPATWKYLGLYWKLCHPNTLNDTPTQSQILYHAKQPEFVL